MKKIFVSLLMAMPIVASAQTAFTVESNGKKYSFPLSETTITVTDEEPSQLVEAPQYKHNLQAMNIMGSLTNFQFEPMTLVSDYVWGIKVVPSNKNFKFQGVTNTQADLYFGPDDTNKNIALSGTAKKGSTQFFNIEQGYEQKEVLLLFNERTYQYSFIGLEKSASYKTIDFEGDYWNALIDPNQERGKLLYGESGYGYTTDKGVYEWTDEATSLHSKLNGSAEMGWAYWNGGVAVSNYECDIAKGSAATQLSLPTGTGAHSGNNFIVADGYNDGSWDSCPVLDFKDGKARKIKGLWITNTSYFINAETKGGYNNAASDDTFIDVTFEGFDAAGLSQGKVKYRIQDGKKSLSNWTYVDLSALGEINSLKVNYDFSSDQYKNGYAAPAYIAIDDVEVYE